MPGLRAVLLVVAGYFAVDCTERSSLHQEARPTAMVASPTSTFTARSNDGGTLAHRDPVEALLGALPDRAPPFSAGALTKDPLFVRRTYSRGVTRINVTISTAGATQITFDDWVKMSTDSPQVRLAVPPNAGAGFYDCVGKDLSGMCNVHIHLRSGNHIEMMGEHEAHRADFDALLSALPLRELVVMD